MFIYSYSVGVLAVTVIPCDKVKSAHSTLWRDIWVKQEQCGDSADFGMKRRLLCDRAQLTNFEDGKVLCSGSFLPLPLGADASTTKKQ